MRRFTKNEKRLLTVTIILTLVCGAYFAVIKPLQNLNLELDSQIAAKERALLKNQRVIRKAKSFDRHYETIRGEFRQSSSNEQVMASMISDIESVARDLNLRISDLKPNRVKSGDFVNRFSVSLTINSSFVEILEFLYNLQSEPHRFDVEEMRFDKGSRRRSETVKSRLVLSKILTP